MKPHLRRSRLTITLMGFGLIVLGLSILLSPIGDPQAGVSTLGWILVIIGALTLLSAVIQHGLPPRGGQGDVLVGAAELVFGLVLVIGAAGLVDAAWTLMGVLVIVTGLHSIVDGTSAGGRVAGAVVCALGVVAALVPLAGSVLGMIVDSAVLVVDGIVQLVLGFRRRER